MEGHRLANKSKGVVGCFFEWMLLEVPARTAGNWIGNKKVNFSNLFINLGSRSDTTTSNDGGIFFRGKSWGLLAYWSENEKVSGNTTFYYYIVYLLLGQTYCPWRVERCERLPGSRKISVEEPFWSTQLNVFICSISLHCVWKLNFIHYVHFYYYV